MTFWNTPTKSLAWKQGIHEHVLRRNVKRFRGGFIFEARRLLYDSTLRLGSQKEETQKHGTHTTAKARFWIGLQVKVRKTCSAAPSSLARVTLKQNVSRLCHAFTTRCCPLGLPPFVPQTTKPHCFTRVPGKTHTSVETLSLL